MRTSRSNLTTRLLVVPALALAGSLAACGSDDDDDAATSGDSAITVEDPWVKANTEEQQKMTGAFGTIVNSSDTDLTVVSADTSASDYTELHEVVEMDGKMVMQEKDGGFVVPAGGEHVLEPGNDHVMIMKQSEPIKPGDEVEITLVLDDDTTYTYSAQARDVAGGDEEYVPSEGHGDMDEGSMEDEGMSEDSDS